MNSVSFFSIWIVVLLFASCGDGVKHNPVSQNTREENRNNEYRKEGMRSPEPVIVQSPVELDSRIPRTTFVIELSPFDLRVKYNRRIYNVNVLPQLDTLIRQQGGAELNGQVALKCDSTVARDRLDSVIDLLGRYEIQRFSLVTDLYNK